MPLLSWLKMYFHNILSITFYYKMDTPIFPKITLDPEYNEVELQVRKIFKIKDNLPV